MDKFEVFKKAELYAEDFTNSAIFKELLEVKKYINDNYSELVKEFKEKKDKFESNKEYSMYNDSFKKIELEFREVKERLYSLDIVQKYFKLEREIQQELTSSAKQLAKSISNKFK